MYAGAELLAPGIGIRHEIEIITPPGRYVLRRRMLRPFGTRSFACWRRKKDAPTLVVGPRMKDIIDPKLLPDPRGLGYRDVLPWPRMKNKAKYVRVPVADIAKYGYWVSGLCVCILPFAIRLP